MAGEEAILEFEIKVTAKASEETKQLLQDLEEAKRTKQEQSSQQGDKTEQEKAETTQTHKVVAEGNIKEFEKDDFFSEQVRQEQLKKDVIDTLNKLDSKGLQTLSSFASNPTSASLNALSQVLSMAGPEGQVILAIIGLAVSTPVVIQKIVDALSVKGGPWNRDFQILIDKQIDVGLSRLLQKRKEQGIDQQIFSQQRGFVPNNPSWTYNSYFDLSETRIARIGLTDRSAGVTTR